ncbi:hypothetical protein [Moumouvirus maliensis]|nr:hypothetical protein [Moumouvirus maliensis]
MEHVRITIPFREDYNGRPICYSFENFIVLRTHPFYCWSFSKYGRVFRYNILDKATKVLRNDFEIYCYAGVSSLFKWVLKNFIIDVLTNDIGDEKIYKYKWFSFKLVKTNEYNSETLIDKLENGDNLDDDRQIIPTSDFQRANRCFLSCVLQCGNNETEPDDFHGFIRTINGIYLIIGDFSNFFGFDDEDDVNDDDDDNNDYKNIISTDEVICESPEPDIIDIYYTPIKQN